VSARTSTARGSALLPSAQAPVITHQARPTDEYDAVLAMSARPASAASFRSLPESLRWRELDALAAPRAGTVRSGERVWNFPVEADYDAELESKAADVMPCALDGKGDHSLAMRFLARFAPAEIPWVHADLSAATRSGGVAHVGTDITGFGVRFALELLLREKVLAALESAA